MCLKFLYVRCGLSIVYPKYAIECPIGDKCDDGFPPQDDYSVFSVQVSPSKWSFQVNSIWNMGSGWQGKLLLDDEEDICQRGRSRDGNKVCPRIQLLTRSNNSPIMILNYKAAKFSYKLLLVCLFQFWKNYVMLINEQAEKPGWKCSGWIYCFLQ